MNFLPLGHSWPGLNWWLSLTSGDQGVWVGGIGSLAAAGVALWISGKDGRRIRADRRKLERVTAAYIYTDIAYLARDSVWIRGELLRISEMSSDNMLAAPLMRLRDAVGRMRLIVERSRFELISQLPASVGQSLAHGLGGYPSSLDSVSSVIFMIEAQALPWDNLKRELFLAAEGLGPSISNVLDFLKWFNNEFEFSKGSRPHEFLLSLLDG